MADKREFTITLDEQTYQFYSLMAKHSYRSINKVLSNTLHDIPKLVWKRGREGATLAQATSFKEEIDSE